MYIDYNVKLKNLKAEIDMNMAPIVQAGGSPSYCFGDLVISVMHNKLAEGSGCYTQQEWKYGIPLLLLTNGIMKSASKQIG